ncbi:MAG TPA: asparagine synthase (glutamine-hydrolyzing) [Candidatus Angelobacter sp.]|jgi:asparagine synthase (glutamine-hydrolysing)
MCGIAGFWQKKRHDDQPEEVLVRMGSALKHRGPNDSGTFCDNSNAVGLVHQRLSILDLSPAGHQPMFSHSGRYVMVFNGEIYNFSQIKQELGPDYSWNGHSDTEVMLEAIECWGLYKAVKRFVGMFAFALWDKEEQKLFLVRDRLGIKPVYYGVVGDDFVFGSELKAIRQYPAFEARVDRDALALYMRHNYVPTPHCIYVGLRKLHPGSILVVSAPDAEPELTYFWSAVEVAKHGAESPFAGCDNEAVDQLEKTLRQAIGLRMIADVPLGAFLSGGIDSSTVVALMQSLSTRPVKTFTIGFREDDYNEATHAKRIARYLGTDHTELYVTPEEALAVVPLLSTMYDEPFADSSQIPTYMVSRLARTSVTVSLSGDGGDELFGGYNRYVLTKAMWTKLQRMPKSMRRIASRAIYSVPPSYIDGAYGLAKTMVPSTRRWAAAGDKAHKLAGFLEEESLESFYMRALSHWPDPSDVVLGSQEPETIIAFIRQMEWLHNIEDRMMLTDQVNYLPDDILTKVDRASMAVSLEARVPILDHRLLEFAWRLPLHFKIRDGVSKWILRQVLYRYVSPEMVERPKMGFGVPIDGWLRGPLRNWAEDLLSPRALESHGLLNAAIIRQRWQEHLSGARNWQYLIWDVLIFQDWYEHNITAFQPAQDGIG